MCYLLYEWHQRSLASFEVVLIYPKVSVNEIVRQRERSQFKSPVRLALYLARPKYASNFPNRP